MFSTTLMTDNQAVVIKKKKKKPSIISTRKFLILNQTHKKPSINYNSSLKNATNQKEILELKLRGELKLLF